jgi:hypothetical protein
MKHIDFLEYPELYDEIAKTHNLFRSNDCACAKADEIE